MMRLGNIMMMDWSRMNTSFMVRNWSMVSGSLMMSISIVVGRGRVNCMSSNSMAMNDIMVSISVMRLSGWVNNMWS